MPKLFCRKHISFCRKAISAVMVLCFSVFSVVGPAGSQTIPIPSFGLTAFFQPPVLKGMTVHPENPLLFDFIVDRGQDKINNDLLKVESTKLIKYFLTSMTIPDKDAWVNLSPTEKDRIIPDALGQTEMGRQMLEQDYVLKQLAASLTNPDTELGKKYWDEVHRLETLEAGRSTLGKITNVQRPATNNFNKVWIVPDGATVVEKDGFAYIAESKLTVMLDEDRSLDGQRSVEVMASRTALSTPSDIAQRSSVAGAGSTAEKNLTPPSPLFKKEGGSGVSTKLRSLDSEEQSDQSFKSPSLDKEGVGGVLTTNIQPLASSISTEVFRKMILPKLIEEVNAGKNFAATRQVYQSVILAAWYKRALKDSLLGRIYADKSKIAGVETDVKDIKQKVYEQYLEAFKKGAYNVIKEESGPDGDLIPRKYFSGGQIMASAPIVVSSPAAVNGVRQEINQSERVGRIALVAGSVVETGTGEEEALVAGNRAEIPADGKASAVVVSIAPYVEVRRLAEKAFEEIKARNSNDPWWNQGNNSQQARAVFVAIYIELNKSQHPDTVFNSAILPTLDYAIVQKVVLSLADKVFPRKPLTEAQRVSNSAAQLNKMQVEFNLLRFNEISGHLGFKETSLDGVSFSQEAFLAEVSQALKDSFSSLKDPSIEFLTINDKFSSRARDIGLYIVSQMDIFKSFAEQAINIAQLKSSVESIKDLDNEELFKYLVLLGFQRNSGDIVWGNPYKNSSFLLEGDNIYSMARMSIDYVDELLEDPLSYNEGVSSEQLRDLWLDRQKFQDEQLKPSSEETLQAVQRMLVYLGLNAGQDGLYRYSGNLEQFDQSLKDRGILSASSAAVASSSIKQKLMALFISAAIGVTPGTGTAVDINIIPIGVNDRPVAVVTVNPGEDFNKVLQTIFPGNLSLLGDPQKIKEEAAEIFRKENPLEIIPSTFTTRGSFKSSETYHYFLLKIILRTAQGVWNGSLKVNGVDIPTYAYLPYSQETFDRIQNGDQVEMGIYLGQQGIVGNVGQMISKAAVAHLTSRSSAAAKNYRDKFLKEFYHGWDVGQFAVYLSRETFHHEGMHSVLDKTWLHVPLNISAYQEIFDRINGDEKAGRIKAEVPAFLGQIALSSDPKIWVMEFLDYKDFSLRDSVVAEIYLKTGRIVLETLLQALGYKGKGASDAQYAFIASRSNDQMRDAAKQVYFELTGQQVPVVAIEGFDKLLKSFKELKNPEPAQDEEELGISAIGSSSAVGGIDFDPSKLNLQIKRDGKGVPLPLPQQDLENININGLYPVILNILPVNAQTLPILGQLQKSSDAVI